MILADKIIMLRKKYGYSQEELAQLVDVSRQAVSKWESAASIPDINKVIKLSKIFSVSVDYLLKDEIQEEEQYITNSEDFTNIRKVTIEEANEFLKLRKYASTKIALATFLCIISPTPLLFLSALSEIGKISENFAGGFGLITLLITVAIASSIYIYIGMLNKPFEFLDKEEIETQYGVTGMVKERKKQYTPTYIKYNIIGVALCILAVTPLFFTAFTFPENDLYCIIALCVLLFIVASGVFLLIISGITNASFDKLLEEGDFTRKAKKNAPFIESISGAYWLITVIIFLLLTFTTNKSSQTWLVFPIAGILFGALMAIFNLINTKNEK